MVAAQILEISGGFFLSPLFFLFFLPLSVSLVFYFSCSLFLSALICRPVLPLLPSGSWWCTVSGNQGKWPGAQSQGPFKNSGAIFSSACRKRGRRYWKRKKGNVKKEEVMVVLVQGGGPAFPWIVLRTFQSMQYHLCELGLRRHFNYLLSLSISAGL